MVAGAEENDHPPRVPEKELEDEFWECVEEYDEKGELPSYMPWFARQSEVEPEISRPQFLPEVMALDGEGGKKRRKLPRGVLVDSGSSVTIANGGVEFPECPLKESPGSRRGQTYNGAGDETLENKGQRNVKLRLGGPEGRKARMNFQDAKVRRPILSVGETTDAQNSCWFDAEGSFMLTKGSPEQQEIRAIIKRARQKIEMLKVNGVYQMETWVDEEENKEEEKVFRR